MHIKIKDRMTLPKARVANALEELEYLYEYEREAVLKYPSGYETVRYPDFYLPELDLYLEVKSMRNKTPVVPIEIKGTGEFFEGVLKKGRGK